MFFLNPLVVAEAFSSASLPLSITSGTGGIGKWNQNRYHLRSYIVKN